MSFIKKSSYLSLITLSFLIATSLNCSSASSQKKYPQYGGYSALNMDEFHESENYDSEDEFWYGDDPYSEFDEFADHADDSYLYDEGYENPEDHNVDEKEIQNMIEHHGSSKRSPSHALTKSQGPQINHSLSTGDLLKMEELHRKNSQLLRQLSDVEKEKNDHAAHNEELQADLIRNQIKHVDYERLNSLVSAIHNDLKGIEQEISEQSARHSTEPRKKQHTKEPTHLFSHDRDKSSSKERRNVRTSHEDDDIDHHEEVDHKNDTQHEEPQKRGARKDEHERESSHVPNTKDSKKTSSRVTDEQRLKEKNVRTSHEDDDDIDPEEVDHKDDPQHEHETEDVVLPTVSKGKGKSRVLRTAFKRNGQKIQEVQEDEDEQHASSLLTKDKRNLRTSHEDDDIDHHEEVDHKDDPQHEPEDVVLPTVSKGKGKSRVLRTAFKRNGQKIQKDDDGDDDT